jgi:hypothetical protein
MLFAELPEEEQIARVTDDLLVAVGQTQARATSRR